MGLKRPGLPMRTGRPQQYDLHESVAGRSCAVHGSEHWRLSVATSAGAPLSACRPGIKTAQMQTARTRTVTLHMYPFDGWLTA